MDADHEWTPVVSATDCTPCTNCGEPVCPRCGGHFGECPCPGPHQEDLFYYREIDGRLHAIPRDAEPCDDREPAEDFDAELRTDDEAEVMVADDDEGPEPDDEDDDEEIRLLDRIDGELLDLDDGFEPADSWFEIGGEG